MKHGIAKIFIIRIILIALCLILVICWHRKNENKKVTVIKTHNTEAICNYLKRLQNTDGSFSTSITSIYNDLLYNTYYALKSLTELGTLDDTIAMNVKKYLSEHNLKSNLDTYQTDYMSPIYYYTELCKMIDYELSDDEKKFIYEMIQKTYHLGIFYSADYEKFNTEEFQIAHLYSTKLAIEILHTIDYEEINDETIQFLEQCTNNSFHLNVYNQIVAINALIHIHHITQRSSPNLYDLEKEIIVNHTDTIVTDFKNNTINILFLDEILRACSNCELKLFTAPELSSYFLTFQNNNLYSLANAEPNYLISYLCVNNLKALGYFEKNNEVIPIITNELLQLQLKNHAFGNYEDSKKSLEQAYYYSKVIKELNIIDNEFSNYVDNITLNSLLEDDWYYYIGILKNSNKSMSKQLVPQEIYTNTIQSYLNNPLEEDTNYMQMLHTLIYADILEIELDSIRKDNIINILNNLPKDNISKRILSILIKKYMNIKFDAETEFKSIYHTITEYEMQQRLSLMDLYYYYQIPALCSLSIDIKNYNIIKVGYFKEQLNNIIKDNQSYINVKTIYYLITIMKNQVKI